MSYFTNIWKDVSPCKMLINIALCFLFPPFSTNLFSSLAKLLFNLWELYHEMGPVHFQLCPLQFGIISERVLPYFLPAKHETLPKWTYYLYFYAAGEDFLKLLRNNKKSVKVKPTALFMNQLDAVYYLRFQRHYTITNRRKQKNSFLQHV